MRLIWKGRYYGDCSFSVSYSVHKYPTSPLPFSNSNIYSPKSGVCVYRRERISFFASAPSPP